MKKRIKILIIVAVLIVFAGAYSVIDKANAVYDKNCDESEFVSLDLYPGENVTQEFMAVEGKIDGVSAKITAIGDITDGRLKYELKDKSTGEIVRSGEEDLTRLKTGKFFEFKFEQLDGCKDKEYQLSFELKSVEEGNGIRLYYTPYKEDGSTAAGLLKDEESIDGTLVLRILTHRFDLETFFVAVCFLLYIVGFMKWLYKMFQ